MTSIFINIYNHVAKRALGSWVSPVVADNDETGSKLHVCIVVTNETTCKVEFDENGERHYESGYDILYYAIYDPKTRKVAECGKYDTGKKMNSLGQLPDTGKLFAFAKGRGKYASVFHAPIAGKKDNHKRLEGTGDVVEAINKYCFDWYNRQK